MIPLNKDNKITCLHYENDGTTPLDLAVISYCYVSFLQADKQTLIVRYEYDSTGGSDSKFIPDPDGTVGKSNVKFDHIDNADNYIGDVYICFEYGVSDSAFNDGAYQPFEGPAKLFTIGPEIVTEEVIP